MSLDALEKPVQRVTPKILFLIMLFPLFMAFAYPAAYVAALHDPAPNQMSLTVIDNTPLAQQVVQDLKIEGEDALDVTTVPTVDAAKQDVLDRDTRAAYSPSTGNLYVATAGGKQATQAAKDIFEQVAERTGKPFKVQELRATTDKDTGGTGYLYMTMVGTIAGYLAASTISSLGRRLSVWTKLAVLLLLSVAAGVISTFITFGLYGVYEDHLLLAALVVFAGFLTASVLQLGMSAVLGLGATLVGIVIFIVLGLPAAGVVASPDMMPGFFRVMHAVLPSGAVGEIMQRTLYFDGHGVAPWILQLVMWTMAGLGLLWVGSLRSTAPQDLDSLGSDESQPRRRRHLDEPLLTAYEHDDAPGRDQRPVTQTATN